MLGDDAVSALLAILSKLLDIAKQLSYAGRSEGIHGEKRTPPIKVGKLGKRAFEKLANSGTEFKYLTVPKDKLEDIEKTVKSLGGSMFTTKIENGNNAVIAVPASSLEAVNTAILHAAAQTISSDPNKLNIKETDKIPAEDIKIVSDVMRKYDIPIYTFRGKDGQYVNAVPKEFEGQYNAALKEARALKKELDNIEITRYEQTSPLDGLDVYATKVSPEVALAMSFAAKQKNLDVKFTQHEGEIIAAYPAKAASELEKAQQEFNSGLEESEKYLIDIKDNTITMDINKLVKGEDDSSYFVCIPNTAGKDYLRIDKADVDIINDGKTLSMKLDMNKNYAVFDEEGNIKTERNGAELSKSYNTKSMYADKDTEIAKYGDGMERVELYSKEQNKLISLGIDSADKMRSEMLEQGISAGAAELLLKEIKDKLPDNYKEIFNYSSEKTEVVYADIPNIGEYLAQSQLSQTLIGHAECKGEIPHDNGPKCCVFDKNANQYAILPVMPRLEVMAALSQMGYSEISAKEIADKIIGTYRDTDIEKLDAVKPERNVSVRAFDANNPELSDMSYCIHDESMMIIKEENDQYKYMNIDKNTPLNDIEKALSEQFGLTDSLTVATAVKQMQNEGIIEKSSSKQVGEAEVTKVTSDIVEISNNGKSVMMPVEKIDVPSMLAIGIDEKTAKTIAASVTKTKSELSKNIGDTLQGLKSFAGEAHKKLENAAGNIKEKVGGNRER